ncbi:MAG TPA: substrate-binding domain-containing protein [Bryobacteraceae bacterium]|nr:substrate-binding domain-containing protein [Bryobacteraceae bacterium]
MKCTLLSLIAALFAAASGIAQVTAAPDFLAATAPLPGLAHFSGKAFQAPGIDQLMDFYGDVTDPQLVVFLAGNQFMVVPELIDAFKRAHPEIQRIFVETIPPGVLAAQIEQGALVVGSMRISLKPDVFAAGAASIKRLQEEHGWFESIAAYASNDLVLMVRKGNPKHIDSLSDLARADIRISMPNPAFEGVARQIQAAYVKAGGEALRHIVMDVKTKNSATILTQIHHRQSAGYLLAGVVDAAPVWSTEGEYQKRLGHEIELVSIPRAQNSTAQYVIAAMRGAPHREASEAFVKFVKGPDGQAIYRKYGFNPGQRAQGDIAGSRP